MVICGGQWSSSLLNEFTLLLMKKLSFLFLLFISQFVSAQCAMCKAVVESGDAEIAEGVNSGILYLMAFPYILVAVAGYFIYKNRKKLKF